MSRYIVTPWRTTADLLAVRQQLYRPDNDGRDQRRYAVDRVLAWKLRGGNLPHAVESTALLVDAVLHQGADVSGHSVRAVYTAAFTRFVTGFCDIGRARERMLEPSSMLQIARQIAMPLEFVALRHEATHEELPGLKRLVSATEQALAWLWQVYWSKLDEMTDHMPDYDRDEFRQHAAQKLREVRKRRLEMLKKSGQQKKVSVKSDAGLGQECIFLCLVSHEEGHVYNPRKVDDLLESLLSQGLLMPSKRQVSDSMDGAFLIWDHVFLDISTRYPKFWLQLMESLLARLDALSKRDHDPVGSSEGDGIVLWVLHVLKLVNETCASSSRIQVMRWCCTHPSHWANQLGVKVLKSADESFVEHWSGLLEASRLQMDYSAEGNAVIVDGAVSLSSFPPTEPGKGWRRAAPAIFKPIGVV